MCICRMNYRNSIDSMGKMLVVLPVNKSYKDNNYATKIDQMFIRWMNNDKNYLWKSRDWSPSQMVAVSKGKDLLPYLYKPAPMVKKLLIITWFFTSVVLNLMQFWTFWGMPKFSACVWTSGSHSVYISYCGLR